MRGATPTYAAIEALMFVIDPLFNGLVPGLGFVWGAYLVRAGKRSQVGRPSG